MSGSKSKDFTRIFLWSTRRVLSTPLQRAIFHLEANGINNIIQHCEPLVLNFHFGTPKRSKQFTDEEAIELAKNWDFIPTVKDVLQLISTYQTSVLTANTTDTPKSTQNIQPEKRKLCLLKNMQCVHGHI